ncbi:MAG: flagellar filament capping protein FliD [Deltaproteobacteria bacterium]
MGNVTFSGLSTGIDTAGLIKALMEAKRQPVRILEDQADSFRTRRTLLDEFAAKLSALRTAASSLAVSWDFAAFTASSGDPDRVAVTASSAASEGSHSISVTQLARPQTSRSNETFAADDTAAGLSGTLTITPAGGTAGTISVDAADSLQAIRDAINNASVPVRASVVNLGTSSSPQYTIVLTGSDSGAAHSFTASFAGTGSLTFAETRAAQDAIVSVDGIADIHRETNVIGDVVTGLTFTLVADTQATGEVSVGVSRDPESIVDKVRAFLDAYNDLRSYIRSKTAFDPVEKEGGPLMGDTAVEIVSSGLSGLLTGIVPGLSGTYTALSRVGVTTSADGTLVLNEGAFETALGADYEAVVDLFAQNVSTGTTGVAWRLQEMIDGWLSPADGIVSARKSGIEATLRRLDGQIEQKEAALSLYETSLRIQFAKLEQMVASLQDQSGALLALSGSLV